MLTLTPTPNTHRQADNLIPLENNQYETRPGFFQVRSDPIQQAVSWGEAVVFSLTKETKSGQRTAESEIYIWHGTTTHPIKIPPDSTLTGTLFQSLTSLGNRENRLYLSNGNTLYYLRRTLKPGGEVTGVTVEPEKVTVLVGAKTQLKGKPVPKWAVNQDISWKSSNEKIATVDDRGLVSTHTEGKVNITATTKEGGYTATCQVTVTPFIPVTAVKLDKKDIEIELPRTVSHQLKVTVEPKNATNSNVIWRSHDDKIATVDEHGKVTGVAKGKTHVVVMSENGGLTDIAKVTVTQYTPVTGVTVSPKALTLKVGTYERLVALIEPKDATNQNVKWVSDDDKVATVDDKGVVTGIAKGDIDVTVTTEEGSFADKCDVKVEEEEPV